MAKKRHVVIVGGGLAGSFLAIALAKKRYKVSVFESRADLRKFPPDAGRSFNLTLYYRGIHALKAIGVFDKVRQVSIQVDGNVCHPPFAQAYFDPYEQSGKEVLYTVHRKELNAALLSVAERFKNVSLRFNKACLAIDRQRKAVLLQDTKTKKLSRVRADIIVGADGVHSVVRDEIQKGRAATLTKEYLDWGYKEVPLSSEKVKTLGLRMHATHTWPRDNSLFIAFPNNDGTFTLMINLPVSGSESFDSLKSKKAVRAYITKHFPPLIPALPEITESLLTRPLGNFITVYTAPWYYKDFLVMLGDAAHGVIPFYGQGMCAAFEDCVRLVALMEAHTEHPEKAFGLFEKERKQHTDVLAHISKENFIELRDKARSNYYLLKAKAHTFLHLLLPAFWTPPLYKMVAHDTVPYKKAYDKARKQERIARIIGLHALIGILSIPYAFFPKKKAV